MKRTLSGVLWRETQTDYRMMRVFFPQLAANCILSSDCPEGSRGAVYDMDPVEPLIRSLPEVAQLHVSGLATTSGRRPSTFVLSTSCGDG